MRWPDAAGAAQLTLLALGELAWLWIWSRALGVATLGVPAELLPVVALVGCGAAGAATRWAVRSWVPAALSAAARAAVGVATLTAAAQAVWWLGAGGRAPWQYGWVPAAEDALLLRGLAAGALAWLAWWRGTALPWPLPTLPRVEGSFRVWMQALGALFLLTAALRELFAPILSNLLAAALVPLGAGLAGMPLARVFDIRRERDPDGHVPLNVGGHWGWLLGGSVAALLMAAFVLSRALVSGLLGSVFRWLAGPWAALASAVDALLGLVGAGWRWLLRSAGEEGIGVDGPSSVMGRGAQVAPPVVRQGSGDLDWLVSLISVATGMLLLFLLWQLIARAKERIGVRVADDGVEEERDYVWPSVDGALGLNSLSVLLARLKRPVGSRRFARRRLSESPAARVRRLYRDLLRNGERAGRPRDPDETPREYQRALNEVERFAGAPQELETVTSLYSRVRYGELPPASQEIASAERAAKRLRAAR